MIQKKILRRLLIAFLMLPILFQVALADPSVASASTIEKVNPASSLMQVALALIAVLAMIFALGWLVKKVSQGSGMASGQMKVVASMALGTRERLAVVDIAGTQILIGVAPGRISSLHTFDQTVIEVGKKPTEDFSQKLKEIMSQGLSGQKTSIHDNHSNEEKS